MNLFSSSLLFISLLLSFATFTFSSSEVISKLDGFRNYLELRFPNNVLGPESLAFDCHGEGPYTSVYDGRIFKWRPTHNEWVEFAVNSPHRDRKLCDGLKDPNKEHICGRPLGIKFSTKTCNLYIADAYFGLLMVGPNGGVAKQLAIAADDGIPFKFLNGLDINEQTGEVYFSDTSIMYQRREWQKIMLEGDKTGRLLKYNSNSKKVKVLLNGLAFPNGVAVNRDGSFVLVAESTTSKIQKFWLKGPKAYTTELFLQLQRPPDNIKRNKNGDFWVALHAKDPEPQNADNAGLQNEAQIYISWSKEDNPVGVKFDEKGKNLEVFDGRGDQEFDSISEIEENNGKLWIGSESKSYVVVVNESYNYQ